MQQTAAIIEQVAATLDAIRARHPLVHCLTNEVVKNYTANLLLAVGAAPAMVEDPDEATQFTPVADALLINLGTLKQQQIETMRVAVGAAACAGKPWVLDPVAVGPLGKRTTFANEILQKNPALVRGNASEILSLAGYDGNARGPDSTASSDDARNAAVQLARRQGAVVLVTGPVDYATDGRQVVAVHNGHPLMTRVTGVGCAMGALAAACVAVAPDRQSAAVATAVILGIAGEQAAVKTQSVGSYQIALLDALDQLTSEQIRKHARMQNLEDRS